MRKLKTEKISQHKDQTLPTLPQENINSSVGQQNSTKEDQAIINEFKKERYKYILSEIQLLNSNFHKYLALYQALITGVIGSGIFIF